MAIAGYEIRVDGGVEVNVGLPAIVDGYRQYDVTGLSVETAYDFEVRSYDRAGNRSVWSTLVTESTLEAFTPAAMPGIYQWFEPELMTGLVTTDPIVSLTDFSGLSHHGTQATAGNRATWIKSGAYPAVARFDGTNDSYLLGDLGAGGANFTAAEAFIVVKIDNDPPASSAVAGLWGFSSAGGNPTIYPYYEDGLIYDGFASTTRKSFDPVINLATDYVIYHVYSQTNGWRAGLNGTWLLDEVADNVIEFWGGCHLGKEVGEPGSVFLDGDVAAFILCDEVQTGLMRSECLTYLGAIRDALNA